MSQNSFVMHFHIKASSPGLNYTVNRRKRQCLIKWAFISHAKYDRIERRGRPPFFLIGLFVPGSKLLHMVIKRGKLNSSVAAESQRPRDPRLLRPSEVLGWRICSQSGFLVCSSGLQLMEWDLCSLQRIICLLRIHQLKYKSYPKIPWKLTHKVKC